MIKKRPVNLYLPSISFPVPAIISILHRLSGILLFLCIPLFLWAFRLSLSSAEGFAQLGEFFSSLGVKCIAWVIAVAFFGHTAAGIRHLVMDVGVGETLKAGRFSAWLVAGLTVLFALGAGYWLW